MDSKMPASIDAPDGAVAPTAPGPMRIGELASASGVPVDTVRYYERNGLLAPAGRLDSGYRRYGAGELKHLGDPASVRLLFHLDSEDHGKSIMPPPGNGIQIP